MARDRSRCRHDLAAGRADEERQAAHRSRWRRPAVAILEALPHRPGTDRVFAAQAWSRSKARLDALVQLATPWVLHDLRRSCRHRHGRMGVAPHIVEAVVNHVSGHKAGVAGVYNARSMRPRSGSALQPWADTCSGLASAQRRGVRAVSAPGPRHDRGRGRGRVLFRRRRGRGNPDHPGRGDARDAPRGVAASCRCSCSARPPRSAAPRSSPTVRVEGTARWRRWRWPVRDHRPDLYQPPGTLGQWPRCRLRQLAYYVDWVRRQGEAASDWDALVLIAEGDLFGGVGVPHARAAAGPGAQADRQETTTRPAAENSDWGPKIGD